MKKPFFEGRCRQMGATARISNEDAAVRICLIWAWAGW